MGRSVQWMKGGVRWLGDHPAARKLFFWAGFPTIRLVWPVQYLILKELIDCGSVLDLGCGRHSMIPILPPKIRKVGVEFFEPAYREALEKGRHHECIHADVLKADFPEKSFDAVALLDVLEHLEKEDGRRLIGRMERWARRKIVIFTPNGFLKQEEYDGNPLMAHRSGWTAEEFRQMGFRVYGVKGFKVWKKDSYEHEESGKFSLSEAVKDLSQIVTYHVPDWAFQLFCVKNI